MIDDRTTPRITQLNKLIQISEFIQLNRICKAQSGPFLFALQHNLLIQSWNMAERRPLQHLHAISHARSHKILEYNSSVVRIDFAGFNFQKWVSE